MSQQNVELALRGYDAFARRDLDAVFDLMHPDAKAHDPPEVPDAAVHRGHAAIQRDWEHTHELLEDFAIDVDEIFDFGDQVVVFVRFRGRGRESGAPVEASLAHVWTVRDGKAQELRQYLDRDAALAAVSQPQ